MRRKRSAPPIAAPAGEPAGPPLASKPWYQFRLATLLAVMTLGSISMAAAGGLYRALQKPADQINPIMPIVFIMLAVASPMLVMMAVRIVYIVKSKGLDPESDD